MNKGRMQIIYLYNPTALAIRVFATSQAYHMQLSGFKILWLFLSDVIRASSPPPSPTPYTAILSSHLRVIGFQQIYFFIFFFIFFLSLRSLQRPGIFPPAMLYFNFIWFAFKIANVNYFSVTK